MKESKILKIISYIAIPFLVLAIVLAVFYEIDKDDYPVLQEDSKIYFQSDSFLNDYMQILSTETNRLIYQNTNYKSIQDGENTIYYDEGTDTMYNRGNVIKDMYYVIIYQKKIFTNVELTTQTNTLEKIKDYIKPKEDRTKFVNIINGNVESNSEIIATKAIQYFENFEKEYYTKNTENIHPDSEYNFSEEIESNITQQYTYITTNIQDFEIYSSYQEELIQDTKMTNIVYENIILSLKKYDGIIANLIPICVVALFLICLYLIVAIGHTKGKEGIDLNAIDHIPLEILVFVCLTIATCVLAAFNEWFIGNIESRYYQLVCSCMIASYFIGYMALAVMSISIIKRIKAKTFWKDSFVGKLLKKIWQLLKILWKKLKNTWNTVSQNWNSTVKLAIYTIIFIMIVVFVFVAFDGLGIVINAIFIWYVLYRYLLKINSYEKLENHLQEMYEGKHPEKLLKEDFTPEFHKAVMYINDISNGFENAIEEGIKSERLKTELITNVSHDIKTPLTSIINYVDLLKKENIKNKKVKEYIEVLENKSQRLKKLTEDLVEASKASSGNLKLDMQKIQVVELLKQSIGEFQDKFQEKQLEMITNYPEKDMTILADNRYLYRVIENIFSNVAKYALENSRVYIDVFERDRQAIIEVKNISKERLNITVDELMQRFVRGDKSRTTEGSGLGLSISKSLTELQKGEFHLQVDGDLFKVTLQFEKL